MDYSGVDDILVTECTFNAVTKQIEGVEGDVVAYVFAPNGTLVNVLYAENGVIDLNNITAGIYIVRIDNQVIKVAL